MITKFRAWDKKDKDIKEVTSIDWSLDIVEFLNGAIEREFDSVIIMQSTGLKDKNGVEIFDGDIVKVSVHNGFDYYDNEVCVVRKSRFHSGLVCINPSTDMECRIFNKDFLEDYQYEVVGNIHENSELLEVEE
ncbi:YopX family protein [Candidatus Enterococcus ferrettii]|uniref:YopX protein domain-containing protein n=1 Tax=Candidatus Enterococcus ferrettii TaxID=2815324 RepID=A0ABV0EI90_9ENTE|nr:YopX family protein [Enterococcus sp. 665A]MBO1341873.1 DNA-packaging protein [Enterococcus sp. 665A]